MKRRSLVLASATFAAGFGMMNCLYWAEAPTTQRGLYTYWSATLGDAVALPALVGALCEADALLSDSTRVPASVGIIGGAIGATVGIASQLAWLADNDPDPNWTIPAPHTFTGAGFYHAGFTVAAAGLILALASRVAWAIRDQRRRGLPTRHVLKALSVAGMALVGFVSLAVADNAAYLDRVASVSSMAALGLGAVAAIGLLAWVRRGGPAK